MHGQTIKISRHIWKVRQIWLVEFGAKPNRCWYAFYLQGFSRIFFFTWSMTYIRSTWPSGNEYTSLSETMNIANYCTLNYGAHMSFGRIHKFCIDVHNSSHIYCFTNWALLKPGLWTNYTTQTGNWYKIFSIKYMHFIPSICCMKSERARWWKGIKHASSTTIGFLGYIIVGIIKR